MTMYMILLEFVGGLADLTEHGYIKDK